MEDVTDPPSSTPGGRTGSAPVRVLLVDDEPLIRAGLRLILEGAPGIEIVGEADDGVAAVRLVEDLAPAVVLMDVRMPQCDGVEATRRIRALSDPPAVVMLTAFETDDFVLDALAAGAAGFLLKHISPADLMASIHQAAAGSMPFSPSVLRRLVSRATERATNTGGAAARLAALSERERQIADLVAEGRTNTEIATTLFLALPTVKTHLARVFEKASVTNRVQLALLVHQAAEPARTPDPLTADTARGSAARGGDMVVTRSRGVRPSAG